MANGGTLFLDELGELGLASQVKLLRVLQEKRFEPVGDSETITSDFRVICATNKQLKLMVEKGTFREDLYFRINLISFTVPPLRERSKDIPALVENFIYQIGELYNKKGVTIDAFAQSYLKEQPFPGNIRELKNLVERVMLISPNSVLSKEDFEQGSLGSSINKPGFELPEVGKVTLDEIEKGMIEKALKDHPNNLSKVARLLGLNRGQLYRRLEKYKLSDYK
jgi:transcriptional regulator with PAS, ATPase and Fis domain